MPVVHLQESIIHYEEHGPRDAPVILTLAPGGLESQARFWRVRATGEFRSFPDPRPILARGFRVIALDQRNAGQSVAPLDRPASWDDYADDHLGLLDSLGVDRFHLLGACIGGPFGFKLIERAADRVASFVVQATSGLDAHNRAVFDKSFWNWGEAVLARRAEVRRETLEAQRQQMFGGDFIFSVTREQVARATTPLLVLQGHDAPHPAAISEEIVALARNATLVRQWDGPDNAGTYASLLTDFFNAHAR
ncbi:MAG: alpha/beta fold hydrolase [Bordetella sp.]|nr:alpha/beta fold hydrolase [Bordetella sp.]